MLLGEFGASLFHGFGPEDEVVEYRLGLFFVGLGEVVVSFFVGVIPVVGEKNLFAEVVHFEFA